MPEEVLDLVPATCERRFVGKRRGHHSVPQPSTNAVLVHHPLRPGVADRFLTMLSSRLATPLVSFDAWPEFQQRHPRARPLPMALAPNRMTEALSEAGGLPPQLEHSPTRQALIDLLVSLP